VCSLWVSSKYWKELCISLSLLSNRKQSKDESSLFAPKHDNHIAEYTALNFRRPESLTCCVGIFKWKVLSNFQGDRVTKHNSTSYVSCTVLLKVKLFLYLSKLEAVKAYGIEI